MTTDPLRVGDSLTLARILDHANNTVAERVVFDFAAFARHGLPYCLVDLGDDRAILVNRDYRPVGIGPEPGRRLVDFAAFPQWHLSGDTLARVRAAPCWLHDQEGANRHLYSDDGPPWGSGRDLRAYAARLRALIAALAIQQDRITTRVATHRDMAGGM